MKDVFKKLWYIFRQKYGQILLVLLLLIICIISIRWGYYLLSNDNYSPELNPWLSIQRYLESPAWRGYRVLGVPSDTEQADIFRSIFFFLLKPILPDWILGQLFYLLCLVVGSLSMAILVSSIVKETKLYKYYQIAFLFSGIVYVTTLWTMWLFYQSMGPYISNFGFLPLLLLSFYKYIKNPSPEKALFVFLASILYTSVALIATLFIIDVILLSLFSVVTALSTKRTFASLFKRLFNSFGIFLIVQLFWLLPFIHYTVTNSKNVVDSYTNKTITASTIDLESEMQTAMNSARFYNRNLFEMDDEKYLFPMALEFQSYDFYKVLGFIPAFLSILAIIFALFKKHKKLLFWGAIALGSWFVIKVINPPFEIIFVWMQEYIPLFKQVLRWPFSKVGQIYLIAVTILSTFGLIYFVPFLSSFFKKGIVRNTFKGVLVLIFLLLPLVYSEYIFRGDIFPDRGLVKVPNDYEELGEYMKENNLNGRIYYAPPANNNYFRKYEWGFWGSQFISYILPNAIMDMSSSIGSKEGEKAMLDLNNIFRSGNRDLFLSTLKKYDVEYILFDKSLRREGYSFDINKGVLSELISGNQLLWESELLSLYKINDKGEVKYKEVLTSDTTHQYGTFSRLVPKSPALSLGEVNLFDKNIQNNELVGKFLYEGDSMYMSSNRSIQNIDNFPTKFQIRNGEVFATPSYPSIGSKSMTEQYKSFGYLFDDYFVIGQNVYSRELLDEGLTVENTYSTVGNISGVKNSSFKSVDLVPNFSESTGSDCSGGYAISNTMVKGEKIASGFRLTGSSDLPCVYTRIHELSVAYNYVVRVSLNWESEEGNYPGYCIYSETQKKCINKEKFFDSKDGFTNQTRTLDVTLPGNEKTSLILYAINTKGESSSKVDFKKVDFQFAPILNSYAVTDEKREMNNDEIFLSNGYEYTVRIPLVYGSSSYIYEAKKSNGTLWEPSEKDSSDESVFSLSSTEGMHQKVTKDILNQNIDLFIASPNTKYMMYWNGKNISNIPASICLIYQAEKKCWMQDIFTPSIQESKFVFFQSSQMESMLSLIWGSSSYKLPTENIMYEFLVMKYPKEWENLHYSGMSKKEYSQLEMNVISNSLFSTFYKIDLDKNRNGNKLLTIPQVVSSGWSAVGIKESSIRFLGNSDIVVLDGWQQGWDISNNGYDTIIVFYWPNLLSYLGYLSILFLLVYLVIKIKKQRKYELY